MIPGLCTDLTSYRLKWGPLLPNEVSRIAQHVKKGAVRKIQKIESGIS